MTRTNTQSPEQQKAEREALLAIRRRERQPHPGRRWGLGRVRGTG
jgi:hypothetical protein